MYSYALQMYKNVNTNYSMGGFFSSMVGKTRSILDFEPVLATRSKAKDESEAEGESRTTPFLQNCKHSIVPRGTPNTPLLDSAP